MGVGLGAAKWAAAVLVVSLILPAATKQWSDNQQQRQLKTEVTTNLAGAVARATTDGGFLLANRIEDPQSGAGLRAAYQNALVTWKSEASALEAQLAGYFAQTRDPNEDSLVQAMRAYNRVVQDYLAYCLFYRESGARDRFLRDFTVNLGKMREQTRGAPRSARRSANRGCDDGRLHLSHSACLHWPPLTVCEGGSDGEEIPLLPRLAQLAAAANRGRTVVQEVPRVRQVRRHQLDADAADQLDGRRLL